LLTESGLDLQLGSHKLGHQLFFGFKAAQAPIRHGGLWHQAEMLTATQEVRSRL